MATSHAGLGIYDGFEGYRDPTEEEVLALLPSCPVVLDTNVLLDIYSFEEPARVLALDVLESIRDRVWVPHQVMREFWRNRHSVIAALPSPVQPIDAVRSELLSIVNSLRPDRERPEEIQAMRTTVETQLDELAEAIDKARGNPLNVGQILLDTSLDPVIARLEQILDGRVGPSFGTEESTLVENGLKRFESKTPPGYKDGEDKADQVPERGTGDYLIWEQALRYISSLPSCDAFVFITNDAKEDWRINLSTPKKRVLGVRPELVTEALDRTGCRLVLLQQSDFYRLMGKLRPGDEAVSESLVEASTISTRDERDSTKTQWTASAYKRLLIELREAGNEVQADITSLAARAGGFITRAQIYEYAGYSEDRSLRRFALPAQRIALSLAEEGLIPEDAAPPLEAVYEGPGRTIGYRVPNEFVAFEAQQEEQLTWVSAAARVAAGAPEHVWSVAELVTEISRQGLRDISGARTPEATLRRDLALRDNLHFERVDGGFRLRTGASVPAATDDDL
ncbi:PIN-like domain-containing protein [Nocardia amamiensis]|uniref:PIN-like domain-containing protein n=1 Tax=Nocardia amamiensis TaxID=404578 RepID=UPI0033FAABD6